jgi:hypothetical protein
MLGADIQDHLTHRLIVQGIPRLVVGGKVQQAALATGKGSVGERRLAKRLAQCPQIRARW